LTVVRFLLGFAIGVSIVVAPAYIAESAPIRVRGSMLVTFQIATTSGIAIAYFVGAALAATESWRLILSLSAIPAVIVLLLVLRLPDTARWLLMNGQREEAVDLLRRVNPDMDSEREADLIEEDLSYEERGSFSELFQGRFRKAGIFVVGLGFLVQITGINAIVYYSPTIIQDVGVTSPTGAIIATGFVQIAEDRS
jgi:MFS family permease